jgi:DNA-binding CsgD family transcriptional regulator
MSGRKIGRWSMKSDRELIELAKSHSLEAIAEKINRSPATIRQHAVRLGLSIKRKAKAKGK